MLNLAAGFHVTSASNFLNIRHELVRQHGVPHVKTSPPFNMLSYAKKKKSIYIPYSFPGGKRQL